MNKHVKPTRHSESKHHLKLHHESKQIKKHHQKDNSLLSQAQSDNKSLIGSFGNSPVASIRGSPSEQPSSPSQGIDKSSSDFGENQEDQPPQKLTWDNIASYAKPPWPEWDDNYINNVKWDTRKPFKDPTNFILPNTIRPVQWVKPTYFFQKPKIIDWTNETLNLITTNAHLCEISELMRFIISEISELYDYALKNDIWSEGEGEIFTRNTDGPWKPWDHIYSKCKAGVKGEEPIFNSNGRYYVRLYYLGYWRRIVVDDTIPILKDGLPGLPLGLKNELWPLLLTKALLKIASLSFDENAKEETKDFSPISCLTSWAHEWRVVQGPILSTELWQDLLGILPKYKPPTYVKPEEPAAEPISSPIKPASPENPEPLTDVSASEAESQGADYVIKKKKKKAKYGQSKSLDFKLALKEKLSKRGIKLEQFSKKNEPAQIQPEPKKVITHWQTEKLPNLEEIVASIHKYSGESHHLIISAYEEKCKLNLPEILTVILNEFPLENSNDASTRIPSKLNHPVHLSEVRDCVLAKPSDRPQTPLWKKYRWKGWAMKKGLIPYDEEFFKESINSVLISTPFAFKKDWLAKKKVSIEELEETGEIEGEHDEFDEHSVTAGSYDENSENEAEEIEKVAADKLESKSVMAASRKISPPNKLMPSASRYATKSMLMLQGGFSPIGSPNGEEGERSGLTTAESNLSSIEGEGSRIRSAESEESKSEEMLVHVMPKYASVGIWIDIEKLTPMIRKLCKFYPPKSMFGSCFTLTRKVNNNANQVQVTVVESRASIKNSLETNRKESAIRNIEEIIDYHNNPQSPNITIYFDKKKTINITSNLLTSNEFNGSDNGFYIFTDSWTDQQIVFSLEMLQNSTIKKFMDSAVDIEPASSLAVPTPIDSDYPEEELSEQDNLAPQKVKIGIYLEPWDWRFERSKGPPILYTTSENSFVSHLSLPPGRNTFRLWLIEDFPEISTTVITSNENEDLQSITNVKDSIDQSQVTPFTLKISSKSPIHVGNRVEIQNYLTNNPVLFLKQCDIFVHNVWSLLLSFGKSPNLYSHVLCDLRRTYCPSYAEPNKINKMLKCVHQTFEEEFLSMIREMNGGILDAWTTLAIRSLLLNPHIGSGYSDINLEKTESPTSHTSEHEIHYDIEYLLHNYKKLRNETDALRKIITIQRYFRGWQVRRLIQSRQKKHKHFLHLEYEVRKIGLMIAKHSESKYAPTIPSTPAPKKLKTKEAAAEETRVSVTAKSGDGGGGDDSKPKVNDSEKELQGSLSEVSIIPKPPKWAVSFMKTLLEKHPMLLTIHRHAYCVSSHLKIKTLTGNLPNFSKNVDWIPFSRFHLCLPLQSQDQWIYCQLDLQLSPRDGAVLKIVNNDTNQLFHTVSTTLFTGALPANDFGYTVLLYRWKTAVSDQSDNTPPATKSQQWQLRLLSPQIQKSILFTDDPFQEEVTIPRNLIVHRFTDYYIPSKDNCVCRYTIETTDLVTFLSLRFLPSCPDGQFSLEIVDLNRNSVVFERKSVGGFILPSVRLEGKPYSSELEVEGEGEEEEDTLIELVKRVKTSKAIRVDSNAVNRVESETTKRESAAVRRTESETVRPENTAIRRSESEAVKRESDPVRRSASETAKRESQVIRTESATNKSENLAVEPSQSIIKELPAFQSHVSISGESVPSLSRISVRSSLAGSQVEIEESASEHELSQEIIYVETFRYTINIYCEEGTWPFNDNEWSYIQAEKQKFWRPFLVRKKPPPTPVGEMFGEDAPKHVEIVEEHTTDLENPKSVANTEISGKEAGKVKGKKVKTKANKIKSVGKSFSETSHAQSVAKSLKSVKTTKSNFEKSVPPSESIIARQQTLQNVDYANQEVSDERSTANTETPSSAKLVRTDKAEYELEIDMSFPDEEEEEYKPEIYESSNVTIKIGGLDSVKVVDESQPNWLLEIVTYADKDIDIKSNRRLLRNKLQEKKAEWESFRHEVIFPDVCTDRHHLRATKGGFYVLSDPCVFMGLMTNLDTAPYLNESDFDRFSYEPGKSLSQEELEMYKELHPTVPKTKGINKHGTVCPPNSPISEPTTATSDQNLYPNKFAGSDFNLLQPHISVLPVDLSIGSPSYLEFASHFADKNLYSVSSSTSQFSQEFDGEDEFKSYLKEMKLLYEKCRAQNAEIYGESEIHVEHDESYESEESKEEEDKEEDPGEEGRNRKSYSIERKCTQLYGAKQRLRELSLKKPKNSAALEAHSFDEKILDVKMDDGGATGGEERKHSDIHQ